MVSRVVILLLALLPLSVSAQGQLVVGEETVLYTESLVAEGVRLFFVDGTVVASAHDTNADGTANVWLVYEGDYVRLEGHDTTGDGAADTFLSIAADGSIIEFSGVAANRFMDNELSVLSNSRTSSPAESERAVRDWVSEKTDAEPLAATGSWWLLGLFGLVVCAGFWAALSRRR